MLHSRKWSSRYLAKGSTEEPNTATKAATAIEELLSSDYLTAARSALDLHPTNGLPKPAESAS